MQRIDKIIFVDSQRGSPDRGWSADDVIDALARARIPYRYEYVANEHSLRELIWKNDSAAFWPLNYTFDASPDGALIVDVLHNTGSAYLTCNPRATRYTSKIQFKQALDSFAIATPPWSLALDSAKLRKLDPPVFVKTEYSCDSVGIRRAVSEIELHAALKDLSIWCPGESVLVEAEAGPKEWTIACILVGQRLLCASLRMMALKADFIDEYAKHHNDALLLRAAAPTEHAVLEPYVRQVTSTLKLSGYFRLDVMTGLEGVPTSIDLNILPALTGRASELSYLPMAFIDFASCSYDDVVGAILGSVSCGLASIVPGSSLDNFIRKSMLLANAGVIEPLSGSA